MTVMTERDKKLVTVLSVVVILVVFGYYLIMPMMTKSDRLDEDIAEAQLQKEEMTMQIALLPDLEVRHETLKNSFLETSQEYYAWLSSQEIDRIITGLVLDCGLESENLSIRSSEEPSSLGAFYASALALEQSSSEAADAAQDASADTASEELPAEELVAQEEAQAQAGDTGETVTVTENTEIYAATVQVRLSGTEEQYQTIIDTLTNGYPAIRVSGYSYQQKQGAVHYDSEGNLVSEAGSRTLTLNLELYMCDKTFMEGAQEE